MVLSTRQLNSLAVYYRTLLRQVQGLPTRTANEALYLLSGMLPLEAIYHCRVLGLFGAIQRLDKDHTMHKLAVRQLAVGGRYSWFTNVRSLLVQYDLDLTLLWEGKWTKLQWKRLIKKAVHQLTYKRLLQTATLRKTLVHLDPSMLNPNQPHPIWKACILSTRQVKMAMIRAQLLTGVYALYSNKCSGSPDPTCPLCAQGEEDMAHFLLTCPSSDSIRAPIISSLSTLLAEAGLTLPTPNMDKITFILNGGTRTLPAPLSSGVHRLANKLVKALHENRVSVMSEL